MQEWRTEWEEHERARPAPGGPEVCCELCGRSFAHERAVKIISHRATHVQLQHEYDSR